MIDDAALDAPDVADVPLSLALSFPPPLIVAGTRSDADDAVEAVVASEIGAEMVPEGVESVPELGGTAVVPLDCC